MAELRKIRIACIVGARPNFMKIAPLLRELDSNELFDAFLIHTGQHYDKDLSDVFFDDLEMRRPDISLNVGSGSHAVQTAKILEQCEGVFVSEEQAGRKFDRVLVVGDVNSTMAATLAAAKLCIPVAHVEAGLRSFDRTMPEEVNRIVTDALSDLHFISEPAGVENLLQEGHSEDHLFLCGNVMIDTLFHILPKAKEIDVPGRFGLVSGRYGVVTLHRPGNVDAIETLKPIIEVLLDLSKDLPIVFPIHPRTKVRLEAFGLIERLQANPQITLAPPLGYMDFLSLTSQAKCIITDSGGLQEESTALEIPCLTVRPNTERPVTVEEGTSTLVKEDPYLLRQGLQEIIDGRYKHGVCPELWDGQAAKRIVQQLQKCHTS